MKRGFIFALVILKLTTIDTADVKAETRLDQALKQLSSRPVQEKRAERQIRSSDSQRQNAQEPQWLLPAASTVETTQISERDRLIQERFLIKILPAQNQ